MVNDGFQKGFLELCIC